MSTYSFDVFDTLLTRQVGSPRSVFLALGRLVRSASLIDGSPESFAQARLEAEARCRGSSGREEVTLDQIYNALAPLTGLSPVALERIKEMELALEFKLLRTIPRAVSALDDARRRGDSIVFTSDMYINSMNLRDWLEQTGVYRPGDELYVSCDHGITKRSGALYHAMIAHRGIAAADVTHCGNHPESDVRVARALGLGVAPCFEGNLNRYEEVLESHSWATEGFSSFLAGASRLARVGIVAEDPRDQALRDLTAGVIAPALVGYVLWILGRARELGLERLYFVSRDGQVLLEIARALAGRLRDFPCELRYLYGSRQAWHLPAITEIGEAERGWILEPTDFASVESLLARVQIAPGQVSEELATIGLGEESQWRRNLSRPEREAVARLLESGAAFDLVRSNARNSRELMLAYLRQEKVLESRRYAMVDLGWHGRIQDSLSKVVTSAGGAAPFGFYFGLKEDSRHRLTDSKEGFFFDGRKSSGYLDLGCALIPLLEAFCTGDHGLVMGYESSAGGFRPRLMEERNHSLVQWGLPLLRKTIERFVAELVTDPTLTNPWADVRAAIAEVLERFYYAPSRREAEVWATFPYEDDQCGFGGNRLARPYGWKDVSSYVLKGSADPSNRIAWYEGSLALSPVSIRRTFHRIAKAKRSARILMRDTRRVLHRGRLAVRSLRFLSSSGALL